MMTMLADAESGFRASVPDQTIERIGGRQVPKKAGELPANNPALTYAPPSNCILHFADPAHEVRPSFSTVVGLSLCSECSIRTVEAIIENGLSARELLELAVTGEWILRGE